MAFNVENELIWKQKIHHKSLHGEIEVRRPTLMFLGRCLKSYFRMLRWKMNNFGRSMNESKFHLVLFKPNTHLFQWSEIRLAWLGANSAKLAKAICL